MAGTVKERFSKFTRKFKLTSHHAIERFGVFFTAFAVVGGVIFASTAVSAFNSGRDAYAATALWSSEFETSKTGLQGSVDGVYTNTLKNKALVVMHFSDRAKISFDAADYEAFLLGVDDYDGTAPVNTPGVSGSFVVFGSSGYLGVLIEADAPFESQKLNLTIRANEELSFVDQQKQGDSADETIGDASFKKHDQWRVIFNPGATGAVPSNVLDSKSFDPAGAFYEVVIKPEEDKVRTELDTKLAQMRTSLAQIASYGGDLATTKVDGVFLLPPTEPSMIDGDEITGESAAEAESGESSLDLVTDMVAPSGFDFDWRDSNVYEGYLDDLLPPGGSYVDFLQAKATEGTGANQNDVYGVEDVQWLLSDGKDLTIDYRANDVTMEPLKSVMNNLSQAYTDYIAYKTDYQQDLLLDLLRLEVQLRDVRGNSTTNETDDFLIIYY